MSKKLATHLLQSILENSGKVYPDTVTLLQSFEKQNIIDAYYAGAMDRIVGKTDIDTYLKKYDNEETNQTERLPD